jgi:hypothetical protein
VHGAIARVGGDLHRALGALLVRAQENGVVRADLRVPELVAVLIGASHAIEQGADTDTERAYSPSSRRPTTPRASARVHRARLPVLVRTR